MTDAAGALLAWVTMSHEPNLETRRQLFAAWARIQSPSFGDNFIADAWRAVEGQFRPTVEALLGSLQKLGWQTHLAQTSIDDAKHRLLRTRLLRSHDSAELSLSPLGEELFSKNTYVAYLSSMPARAEFWKHGNARICAANTPGIGSAFFVDRNLVATAAHVCEGFAGQKYAVYGEDGREYTPLEVYRHPEKGIDLACIRVEQSFSRVPMQLSRGPTLLEEVVAFGYPPVAQLSDILIATRGEVAAITKDRYGAGHDVFLLSCLVRPGNSGGPIIGASGTVVGIVSRNLHHQSGGSAGDDLQKSLGVATAVPTQYLEGIPEARHLLSTAASK